MVLDLETSGLPHQPWARIVEVAAVALRAPDGEELPGLPPFSTLVKPDLLDHRSAEAMNVNGIRPADLRYAPDAHEAWDLFCQWSRGLPAGSRWTVTAWKSFLFDKRFCEAWGPLPWANWCIWEQVKNRRPRGSRDVHLKDALKEIGEGVGNVDTFGPRHRALTDARLAGRVVRALALGWSGHGKWEGEGGK